MLRYLKAVRKVESIRKLRWRLAVEVKLRDWDAL
jgi:hypothetical protein